MIQRNAESKASCGELVEIAKPRCLDGVKCEVRREKRRVIGVLNDISMNAFACSMVVHPFFSAKSPAISASLRFDPAILWKFLSPPLPPRLQTD
jgi:hypothetical protein